MFKCWKIEVLKEENNKIIKIYDQKAGITELELNNKTLQEIILSNVAEIGNHFLVGNYALINITLPRAKVIGKFFCANNENLEK